MSTHISDDRDKALIAGYEVATQTCGVKEFIGDMSFGEMKKSLKDWDVKSVDRNGKSIGMAISKDGECHFCILPKYQGRWLSKPLLKEIARKVDCRSTSVNIRNVPKQRFVEKVGFRFKEIVGDNIIYRLERLKWT